MHNPAPFKQGGVNNFNNHQQSDHQMSTSATPSPKFSQKNSLDALLQRQNKLIWGPGAPKCWGHFLGKIWDLTRSWGHGDRTCFRCFRWPSGTHWGGKKKGLVPWPQFGTCLYLLIWSTLFQQPLESWKWKITKRHSLVVSGRSTAVKASGLRAGESCSRAKRRCNLGHGRSSGFVEKYVKDHPT